MSLQLECSRAESEWCLLHWDRVDRLSVPSPASQLFDLFNRHFHPLRTSPHILALTRPSAHVCILKRARTAASVCGALRQGEGGPIQGLARHSKGRRSLPPPPSQYSVSIQFPTDKGPKALMYPSLLPHCPQTATMTGCASILVLSAPWGLLA
jgi:hypothetical protein